MTPELSVCVPTLDRANGRVERLAQSLAAHTSHIDYELVVVDCKGEIRGYTVPQNEAMALGQGKFLLAMNDDVEVTAGWIDPLLEWARAGVWCTTPDQTHQDGPQIFAPYCMLWRRHAWEHLGGLDERFVMHGSDIDLALRLINVREPPVRVKLPNPIRHELNATSSEHPELGPICAADLERFRAKWGVDAETMKHELAAQLAA